MNDSCVLTGTGTGYKLRYGRFWELILFLCILNAVAAIVATVGNSLVLVAIWRTPSLRSPSYVLLAGLALSDPGVGLIAQPIFVILNVVIIQKSCYMISYVFKININVAAMLGSVTLNTLCAVAFDRFLAVKIHLRYQELVTVRRTLFLLSSVWVLSAAFTVWVSTHPYSADIFQAVYIALILAITLWCYFQVFQIVRHHQSRIQSQAQISRFNGEQTMPNIARYKNSVRSVVYIMAMFIISYLPWVRFFVVCKIWKKGDFVETAVTSIILNTITFLNSCINPFLYCWRMEQLHQAVKETINALF